MTTCWAYCVAYNEATLIGYWVRHYCSFCERVIVYVDETTTDETALLAVQEGAECYDYASGGVFDDVALVNFARAHYADARGHADYVIWVDADEILYHPRLPERLEELHVQGVNCPEVRGFAMIGKAPPTGNGHIYDEITRGLPAPEYSKTCIFDPALDVTWQPGKHQAVVGGAAAPVSRGDGRDVLRLLHYRWLGEAWHVKRNKRNWDRIDRVNRQVGHGREVSPDWRGPYSAEWFRQHTQQARDVLGATA